jgi:lipopolysaccharide/colanic/teichoic acid biosynthesis glycosyltransferase
MAVILAERRFEGAGRRAIDLVVATLVVFPVLVLVLLLAVLIKLDSPGRVFVRHDRVGRGGRRITIIKLRTMVEDAEQRKAEVAHLNILPWPDFKIPDDPRVTRVGRWLRRMSLDELAQLWNLFRGDVTLVGPRACSIDVSHYELWQTERLEAVPGIFGRWQAEGRGSADFRARCRMDIGDMRRRGATTTAVVAAKTIMSVISGRGAS